MEPSIDGTLRETSHVLEGEGYRVVESQSQIATVALVDTLEEQRVLEELVERTKPRAPSDASSDRETHYLISTPFRYPPLRHGSRFGSTAERGIFYGAEALSTALAETAFYALLFVKHSEGLDRLTAVSKTAFRFGYRTALAIDLTKERFHSHRARLEAPDDYSATQALGRSARELGIEVIRFRSIRCEHQGCNIAVLSLSALEPQPLGSQGWHMILRDDRVDFLEREKFSPRRLSFAVEDFVRRGVYKHPSLSAGVTAREQLMQRSQLIQRFLYFVPKSILASSILASSILASSILAYVHPGVVHPGVVHPGVVHPGLRTARALPLPLASALHDGARLGAGIEDHFGFALSELTTNAVALHL